MELLEQEQKRLANIRMQVAKWEVLQDISVWESAFLLNLIDKQQEEIKALKKGKLGTWNVENR